MMTDRDNAICLATYTLELRLLPEDASVAAWVQRLANRANPDEPVMPGQAVSNLRTLASYHRARFQTQHAIIDLNEAIDHILPTSATILSSWASQSCFVPPRSCTLSGRPVS
ncbi:hypothetical protein PISMIDRAFT_420793 [Pisolithus microcarpus 441]|uniref:Uncharacterized protein n=1 Tax=Pisolithus microcarpus 441 TaxID=765257 RepID=A0A0C9Z4M8_9AGAM|nr:hypothetical protein BKA83DRAFT_420793 [Pisolithus microcarpus]KIK24006.1 hypothetical protein PISMIDRAFT_420793 [Pisolithus microcarpus 441]